jgi:hypothetical protein
MRGSQHTAGVEKGHPIFGNWLHRRALYFIQQAVSREGQSPVDLLTVLAVVSVVTFVSSVSSASFTRRSLGEGGFVSFVTPK